VLALFAAGVAERAYPAAPPAGAAPGRTGASLAAGGGAAGASPARPPAPELVVEAPARLAAAARRVEALDRERLWTAVELAGLDDPGPPIRIVLAPEGSPEARAVRNWVAGYARGAAGPIVIFPERTPTYPDGSLEELVHHEVAHVLIARAARGRPLPRWFNEGVAMAAGGAWGIEDRGRLALATLARGPVPLAATDALFAGGGGAAARAYAVAGAYVRDLRRRYGSGVTGDVLARVGRGVAFEDAFRQATGEPLAAAEASFWRRQTFGQRWLPFLTSSFALWLAVTLLALWAFRRRRRRDAELAERWALAERASAPPGPGGDGEAGGPGAGSPWVN
jgi:hypothetical protein